MGLHGFVPATLFELQTLFIGIGQRYNVIVTVTGNPTTNHWFRSPPRLYLANDNKSLTLPQAIIRIQMVLWPSHSMAAYGQLH